MRKRLGLLLVALVTLSTAKAEEPLGLKFEPLPPLQRQHLSDPGQYSHFECKTEQGPEAAGLYPKLDKYPDFQSQEAYSSPNGPFPNSHASFGGPQDKPGPGPLPIPLQKGGGPTGAGAPSAPPTGASAR